MRDRMVPRRATIFVDSDGLWHFRVQATNWRTIVVSEGFAQRRTVVKRIEREYPGIEVVDG